MFRAEDTSRANYRSLFEYAAGVEARLAQDRRLVYYEQVLPEMLTRVKGLPLMYQTYSKRWSPESSKDAFIVKRRVPDLSKPIYITDDEGNKVQKGFETQDLVMENDKDIPAFMTRKGRFKGQHGFNKGFSYLAPIYHVERDQMPFVLVDLDIDRADFSKAAWGRLLTAVTKVYDWFRLNGFDPLINFTGSSFHIWAKDGQVRSYAETKLLLEQLSKEVDLPLAAGAAHIKGQITIDYPQNKYRAPLRFPLSIHGDTGLASIIIPRNQLRKFDPLTKAHPDQVLKQLPNHLAKIDAWFSDLPQTKQSAESIITAHLDTLNEDDQERCMWGDCGVLADELMLRLQAAGYTDAVYEIGLAYIHPFEEYDDKTFIGGHVVVTVDGESYDVLGAGAKQRWVDGPVVQEMLSSHGYIDLGPLLSSHLTVNWITSPWNEEHKTRSHNFAGKLVDFESEGFELRPYTEGFPNLPQQGWFTNILFHGYDKPLGTEELPALKISYRLKHWPTLPNFADWGGEVRELHLSLHPDYQGQGLAAKMVRSSLLNEMEEVYDADVPFYLAYGRIINPDVFGVVDKLRADPLIKVTDISTDGEVTGVIIELSATGKKIESEEMSKTWYSSGNVHPWQLFLDTETFGPDGWGERDNYPYEDMKALESKYGLKPTSAVIWVSAMPEVAASYMIGQGLLDNSDEEVKDNYGFSKSDLETTEFGQVYYPPHVDQVGEYQGTVMLETDDGDGGYLLSLNRDYTGRYGLKRIGMAAETEYKKKRQKPTPEPGVEGIGKLKPSRRKPPMKVKGSDVYSVQKHRATKRGSHRDIRIGLDGKLLSFVPVGRYEKKDEDGKWQKSDGSRLPKKIGEGVSVIRTEDHPFDYWWFEGEIPKDSYGAGPVSLETQGTRRIIEWIPDEKLKVEFIGGKYAGTYTFERSKKSKDGKVWWMRKSRPIPKDKTDKKTKKSESLVMRHSKLNFTRAFSSWVFIHNHQNYSPATRYIDNLLNEAKYMQGKIILYRAITLANPEDFDPTETGESWTPNKYFAEPYFGHHSNSYEKYILTALVPVESIDWEESVARAIEFGPPSDEKEIVLKRGAPIELINLPMELSFAIDATPEALIRAAEELERFVDEPAREIFTTAFAEWSEKFQAGALPLVAGGRGFYHNWNQDEPTFKLDSRRMISDAFDLEPGPNGWSQLYGEWIYESISQNTTSGNKILPPTSSYLLAKGYDEASTSRKLQLHMQEFWYQYWKGYFAHDEEVQRQVDEVNRHYIEDAMRYVENLLMMAGYAQDKLILYRAIILINPEDFDPTEVGQSWTPNKSVATPYFGHLRFSSRKLGIPYSPETQESNTYILKALVPVESVDWYTTVLRALVFEEGDEKEIVLKTGAPIELVDVPLDLSFAIDATPEALIRASEEEDDEDWWFTMNTPLGPDEEFGPYDSHEEAMKGIERVMQKVISLQDGYTREFPRAYQGRRGAGFGLRAEGVMAWVGTPVVNRKTKKAEEKWYGPPALEAVMNEDVRDQYGYSMFSKALAEWSEKFLAGEGNAKEMIERAYYYDGAGPGDGLISDYNVWDGLVGIESGDSNYVLPESEAIERFARRYVEDLLISAKYYRGRIKLYRGIQLVNPEDFDPTEVGQSWTPIKSAAKPYFGFNKYYSRKLERTYSRTSDAESYVLIALVPVESVDWYTTLMRALAFGLSDEKEIVLKTGATIELIDIPLDLSFAIDGTPEALIRAAEEDESNEETFIGTCQNEDLINDIFGSVTHFAQAVDEHGDNFKYGLYVIKYDEGKDIHSFYLREKRGSGFGLMAEDEGGKSTFEGKYLAKVAEYESSNKWREDVRAMDVMGDETYIYALEERLEYMFPKLEHPLSQAEYDELKAANPKLVAEEASIARSISDDMLYRVYEMLFGAAEYYNGKLLLYREIHMTNPEDFTAAKAGIFWTPVLKAAEAHWGLGGDSFILRALVDFEDIMWESSWYANLIMPNECEIRLKQGAKIELLPLTHAKSGYGRNIRLGGYVYPEEIVYEIDAPNPNLLAVERGTETELLEAIKDLPEEYQRLIGIYPVEPQPTRTGFASEEDEVVLYHGTAAANIESILQEGLRPTDGWSVDSNQTGVFLTPHPDGATSWARWSAMKAIEPESKGASVGETRKFYSMMARLRMQESDAVAILEVRIPKDYYQDLYCDVADLIDSDIIIGDSYEDLDVSQWDACMQNGIDLVFEGGAIPPEWISVLPWQDDWVDSYWSSVIADMIAEHGEDYFGAEDIDLTVGEAFDKALAEIRADVDSVQPHSKDLSDVTFEDYNMAKAVYQSFMVPAGITGSIVRDEWYYESEPIYLWSDIFTLPEGSAGEEWKQKIDAQKTETESDILASNEINYAFYWFAVVQINSIYSMLLSRLGERKMYTGVYTGPPVELPEIIESQRDETEVKIYRWLATSPGEEPVRRLRNRMRPVDVNYYGGYSVDYLDGFDGNIELIKGLKSLSYGPCWSLSPDAYTRTDQWRLAQEDVIHKENEKVGISLKRKLMDEEIDTRTYVIEKSLPASGVDWYSTLISSALWLDSPEYEVIPKRGVFLSEEITDSSDFEQEFNKVVAEVTNLFKEFSWFSNNQKELYDVSNLHNDEAGRARLRELESHLSKLTRPGSLLWSSGDDSAYDAYPDDLRNPEYIFQDSGIFVDEDGEFDGFTDEERGETYEEGHYFTRPFEESPDLDIRLRYAYTLNRLSKLAEQYFGRLKSLRTTLEPQFASGEVTLYRAFSLPEGEVPQLRRMTIFPLSMRIGDARRMENKEQRVKYNYESYGAHWSLLSAFQWSDDFPIHYGEPYIMEKQIPYTDVDWFTTLLVMAYGREPEWEVAVNENVFLAENEVKIPLYHVTPLDQVGNILETGLEPRIGPRSEAMELEPRVYLFGDQESVDQALMNWLGDEMYGAEWRSGYAVLRIDLPADWFKQRRVEKTFHPYGSERSWEWSTSENIPGEFIEFIDKWTWSEDELVDFQADFGMPVYGKYLRDARNQAELDLSTISDDYKYFHLSWDRFVINQDGETFTFTPRVPENPFGWMSGSIEDDFTPRVSLSSTVKGCLEALPKDDDGRWYVYGTKQTDNIISVRDYFEACPEDYGRHFNIYYWIKSLPEEDQYIIKDYSEYLDMELSGKGNWGINVSDLPPKYRDLFYGCVPDAMQHDEYWSLEPITMDYLGYITWVTLGPSGINEFVYFSAPESTEIKYPLRLYHGTSVRNWRAIQSSGELRTGCLASSHGYDIDMPDTYIDLAIGEIEDNHPDIKAGGVVLEVVFPDQATADQYLQADTTMYDLGMAVLEDDLYSRYAPADWQPEDAQEGWHYGSWDWFETDFQDLVKSNQATKTIPYSPQDLSDWQASYLSVYSVCIKQPIPLKYITVDWGSESRRAEEETSETVGEAWDKALVKWYEIVDWAKHEREKGFRDVSTTELQQAIEVYNILYRVSNKISEPNFLGGSLDETIMEQLLQTYAKDDLELEKTLREHYEELHILTIPYVVKSKTMNYFFYYGIIEWIIMMTWRLNSLNSYGGRELDDAISSQFQDSTLKAYRWISVGNDEVPSRNMNFNNYADFSYGAHWSLHPEVYTRTTEWEGFQKQKDYLIEKDVPVEDIDWFETLISCLFFLDTPELEIIMNPMAFIAETIDEPHLYLDMDGCFADFAGAITQRVNEVLQVQDVSEIPSKSLRRAARKAKELGITSVTERDFDLSLSHDPVKKKVIDRMLYKIASEPGFFYNLEVMNRDVLDEIIASGRPFSFLSAPIGGTKDYSIEDKRAWVRDRLGLDVTVNVVPREEKVTFCQPGDVLIDDHVTTISEWTAAGGQGVLFPQEIDEFLRKPYNGGTTTYQAEEVEKVKQYPIVYKKNATGTLQQWQVLLLPQESGGYLLTTASGKVGGKITQGRGKLIKEGKVNRTALEQAELQADSKFKKKKDEGYFPTKEEAHQNLVLLPMKALDFKKRSHDITYPAVAQRKFDGVRCLAIPQADGSVRLMSRTGKTWTHLHHLQSQIEALNLDSNMVLDGEVYSDTLTFEDATGLVRRQTLKPGDEEKMKQIDYRLYDAILLDNPNATFLDRYSKLAALFPPASSTEGRRMGHLVLTENFPLRNREDLLALHRQFTTDEDFEGVMVRNLHGTYDINKRSKHLQKFKEFQDAEYKIVGYNEASGDWQGTPIWICEMADGRQFNVTPTGDRPSRIEMFNNIEDYMGKLLTVKFFELTADGVPRHGVGLAIRDYE